MTFAGTSDSQPGFMACRKKALESIPPAEIGMRVDSEILLGASRTGLRAVEVPASVTSGTGDRTSKLDRAHHTFDLIFSILKLTSACHPPVFFGVPRVALMAGGAHHLYRTVALYSSQQAITALILTHGLIAFAVPIFGLLAFLTGTILFTTSSLVRKTQQ